MRSLTKAALLVAAAALAARPAAAATADEVDATIARAQAWLLARPSFVAQGNWEAAENGGRHEQTAGLTSLVTYSLLASGISPNDPRLRRPIDYLRRTETLGTYALGLRAQVWSYLPRTPDNAALVTRDFRLLMRNIESNPTLNDAGLFDYTPNDRVRVDLSVSQYGTLGLWACARLGAEVSPGTWRLIDNKWKALQDRETGGWAYTGGDNTTLAITAAGVATLYITLDSLAGPPQDDGNAADAAIDRGVARLAAELPGLVSGPGTNYYALYGVERIGVAGGYKFIGDVDWYAAGADHLCRLVNAEGHWAGEWGPEVDTAFALLFLARGREPVMMNKIKYAQLGAAAAAAATPPAEGRWNQRGRDVANAAQFVGQQIERSFNWQIIDLGLGSIRDLHDAPIAYLSFRRGAPPRLAPEALDKLRAYVEGGGMLLLNADWPPRDRATTRAATQAAATPPTFLQTWFPHATLRPLPADHPILRGQQFKAANWQRQPTLYEVTNGVRTLALYLADDPGRAWQLGEQRKEREKFELIADVYQYAIDKEHAQVKGRTHYVEPPATQPAALPGARARVARLRFAGNWDPEPGGWRRVRSLAWNEGIDVSVEPVDVEGDGLAAGFAIAHLTGVGPFRLSPAAVERLRAFVNGGGLLVVDAAGGDKTFAADVERALGPMADAFSAVGKPIPAADPLYADAKRGPLPFGYRAFALASIEQTSTPRIRGTKFGGRWGVLYSPEDLTAGLVGQQVDGIRGYTPAAATEIVLRLVRRAAAK